MTALRNLRLLLLLAVFVLVAAACDGEDAQEGEAGTTEPAAEETAGEDPAATGEATEAATQEPGEDAGPDDEAVQVDVGCQVEVPEEGPGGADQLADDPVGTAVAAHPQLATFDDALVEAGLRETLDEEDATFTVFAPVDAAFEELPEEVVNALLEDGEELTETVSYHLVGTESLSLQELVDLGVVLTMQGGEVTIEAADEETVSLNDGQAQVVCADVETANGTIHLIDGVMMPSDPAEEVIEDTGGLDPTEPGTEG